MKFYITFGQIHKKKVGAIVFDKDCVGIIEAENQEEARKIAKKKFDNKYCFCYTKDKFNMEDMQYYPRGFFAVN